MRSIVFFDLPNVYLNDRKNYTKFKRFLRNEGFLMLQESVYSKLVLNSQQASLLFNRIKKNAPKKGIIQVLLITEKQYFDMEFIIGNVNHKIIESEDRLIVL